MNGWRQAFHTETTTDGKRIIMLADENGTTACETIVEESDDY